MWIFRKYIALIRIMIKMSNVMNAKMQPNAQMQTNADYFDDLLAL